jgi:hypothetical protein
VICAGGFSSTTPKGTIAFRASLSLSPSDKASNMRLKMGLLLS